MCDRFMICFYMLDYVRDRFMICFYMLDYVRDRFMVCFQSSQNDADGPPRYTIESEQKEEECSSSDDEDYGDSKYDKMVTGIQNGIKHAYRDNKKGSI